MNRILTAAQRVISILETGGGSDGGEYRRLIEDWGYEFAAEVVRLTAALERAEAVCDKAEQASKATTFKLLDSFSALDEALETWRASRGKT